MLWTPAGPTVTAVAATATRFVPTTTSNVGGIARVSNTGTVLATFSLGGSSIANNAVIPLTGGQDLFIGFGQADTHINASSTDIRITPGVGVV